MTSLCFTSRLEFTSFLISRTGVQVLHTELSSSASPKMVPLLSTPFARQCKRSADTHSADTVQTQCGHSADTVHTQCRHSVGTVQTQCRHSADTVQAQCRHSADTHSADTVPQAQKSPYFSVARPIRKRGMLQGHFPPGKTLTQLFPGYNGTRKSVTQVI